MFAIVKAFIAGILSVLVFHQGAVWALEHFQVIQVVPWSMRPLALAEVPKLVVLAGFGGLWGVLVWLLIRRAQAAGYYVGAILLGAILPTAIAVGLAVLLHRRPPSAPLVGLAETARLGIVLAVNAAWGLGLALLMRVMHPPR